MRNESLRPLLALLLRRGPEHAEVRPSLAHYQLLLSSFAFVVQLDGTRKSIHNHHEVPSKAHV